jgi:hypothetical protein
LGYLFGGFLIAFACAVAGLAVTTAMSTMKGMQRVPMPGRADISLPAGPSTLYVEGDASNVECTAVGLVLEKPKGQVSYSLAGYHGRNAFDVQVTSGNRYELACTGSGPFVIAVGAGVGAWIVITALAVIPFLAGLALVIVTAIRRARARRQAR